MNTLSTPIEPGVVLEHRLSAADRCDSCGAQAYIAAEVNGSELLFCAHHGRQHADALKSKGAAIVDETNRLVVSPMAESEER